MRETRFGLAVWVCLAVLGACSDSAGVGGSLAALGVDDGASKGASKSVMATGKEDVRITLKTGALMDVPAGAVSKNVELTMERPADTKAVELVERFKKMQDRIVSAPYVLTPHGTKFQQEVTLTLPLAKEGKREVSVAWLENEDDTEWKLLGKAKTDAAGKKAEVKLKHFSVVVIVEDASDLEPVDDIDEPEADAGADAGDETPDAGGSALDASAPQDAGAELDASDAVPDARVELDAAPATDSGGSVSTDATLVVESGIDASGPPDSGAADASDDGPFVPLVDAGAADAGDADASDADASDADAGDADAGDADASDADAGPPAIAQYVDLENCGYLASAGNFSVGGGWFGSPFDGTWQMCMHQCYATDGTCFDNQAYRCDLDAGASPSLEACQSACQEPSSQCPNDADAGMQLCNGVVDCPFGVDEQGCDPNLFFTCQGSERVPMYRLCDGQMNCSGSQDEANCFFCDGERRLAPYRVCDGVLDCTDHTDEQQGCAAIQCALID